MTYAASDKNYANIVKALPADAAVLWFATANEAQAMAFDHNGCVRAAWDEVNKNWHRPAGKNRYTRKDNPGPGDVHVDAPLGSKKPKRKITNEADTVKFETTAQVCKVDLGLGLVFGWAIICTKNGEPYFDLQVNEDTGEPEPDHIPEDTMLKSAAEFMIDTRTAGDMHERDENNQPIQRGTVVFAWPLTGDVAKAMGIKCDTTGLMIAMKPNDPDILQKFRDGIYTGFSIGGFRGDDDVID